MVMAGKLCVPTIMFIAFAVIAAFTVEVGTASSATELPVRIVKVTFERTAREEFVKQVRKFADTHAFAIRVSQSSPDPDDTLVQMWRQDAKMLVVRVRDTSAQQLRYDVGIYANGDRSLPMTAVDQLVEGLRLTVQPIPLATFTTTK
jgi:hypothetical protein